MTGAEAEALGAVAGAGAGVGAAGAKAEATSSWRDGGKARRAVEPEPWWAA